MGFSNGKFWRQAIQQIQLRIVRKCISRNFHFNSQSVIDWCSSRISRMKRAGRHSAPFKQRIKPPYVCNLFALRSRLRCRCAFQTRTFVCRSCCRLCLVTASKSPNAQRVVFLAPDENISPHTPRYVSKQTLTPQTLPSSLAAPRCNFFERSSAIAVTLHTKTEPTTSGLSPFFRRTGALPFSLENVETGKEEDHSTLPNCDESMSVSSFDDISSRVHHVLHFSQSQQSKEGDSGSVTGPHQMELSQSTPCTQPLSPTADRGVNVPIQPAAHAPPFLAPSPKCPPAAKKRKNDGSGSPPSLPFPGFSLSESMRYTHLDHLTPPLPPIPSPVKRDVCSHSDGFPVPGVFPRTASSLSSRSVIPGMGMGTQRGAGGCSQTSSGGGGGFSQLSQSEMFTPVDQPVRPKSDGEMTEEVRLKRAKVKGDNDEENGEAKHN